ncbi:MULTISPECIES: energy-coupling factor ABC transporter ATP-binding protein [Gordonia]|jgi:biotin transport system ATP-binding protein|uniref:Cobalt ABC transporter ATP-binding protein n=2 Tax=Gordonia alkanivorans TaxID=84096 RepID=W9DJD6_9ACTN|nr:MULTISPECIES: ABC transporter ATP-binding protein [Gordonia]ETA08742.1 cobalt ABC transporter ATP-binding protein [Gordonia alkanivorans CGMCC 6845]MDH3005407.1 ABC transporter ATP-binding protein [Gordonia alkanivorans]MDH3014819.1 ABC transporter ATP-binding protein [Gordonia alkanivorans]MDH3019090.1 ABC transporter ATP-binding protein [Gordonia alkanivorans]MDH3023041.1 ABC transporter ATP-binding protein [Gordonia alkanivorans]
MIEFTNVSHAYDDRVVLRDVSLNLTENRIGIVGANGSGKSTLARMINALVVPGTGMVTVDGLDVSRNKREVRRRVGFIFSDPDRQIIMPTVIEDIELSLRRTDLDKKQRAIRALEVLERFGLGEHADHPAQRLSGGQKQLLALASIFVTDPAIIVADEPTTLLDLRNTRMLTDVFATLDEQLIVVSHDLDILDGFDRVIVIDDGRVVADDEPSPALAYYRTLMS